MNTSMPQASSIGRTFTLLSSVFGDAHGVPLLPDGQVLADPEVEPLPAGKAVMANAL